MAPPYAPTSDGEPIVRGQWKAGLCHCCDHPIPNGLMCWCCPCVALSQIVARVGLFDYVLTLLVLYVLSFSVVGTVIVAGLVVYLRTHIRRWFGIPGSIWGDVCIGCCCCCCAVAQMATHVDAYTPGKCSFESKHVLPGYDTNFEHVQHPTTSSYDAPPPAHATYSEHV
ncbi:hypothetical protein H310_14180 [Aphanomyces invadans]|uniref:PLAC8 family protein n=1 Tax=Aphanomyces invadans TaxID=157072 RepID=A0A024TAV0_9STRA|nr:hypothetical protein H310_14180 [Aphanomyces invadans]ETV91178.1 hypothetical protein H310_14180 [Aphanomyces invadans]|eukprot:XP_008880209.1 hypothetical protein H310_14180 [Aphanomyces invadans]